MKLVAIKWPHWDEWLLEYQYPDTDSYVALYVTWYSIPCWIWLIKMYWRKRKVAY